MAVDERSRKELYDTLETTLGSGPADTMMSLLPPVGWADVATKQDIGSVRTEIESVRSELRAEIQAMKQEVINAMTWRVFVMMAGMLVGIAGIVAAFVVPLYT